MAKLSDPETNPTSAIRISEMRKELEEKGLELDMTTQPNIVEEVYEEYILKQCLEGITNRLDDVPFPKSAANTIDQILNPTINGLPNEIKNVLCDVYFSDGGQFISGDLISNEMIAPTLDLFSTLVTYKKDLKYTKFDHQISK